MNEEETKTTYLHIGDISKNLGISTRSIRYYEELGMIIPHRSDGGFREYSDGEVEKIQMIIKLKRLGLSLDEIKELTDLKHCVSNRYLASDLLEHLHKRLHEFEEKVVEYKEGIDEIKELIQVMESCGGCKKGAEVFKCEKCLKDQDKDMPHLMKTML